jgi:outer membrane immunogenic protein
MRIVAWGAVFATWSGVALAADLPPPVIPVPPPTYAPVPPAYNWTSIYVGANAGYGFATATATVSAFGFAASASENLNGFLGGGQVGALYQYGYAVFGFETDFDATGQSTSTTILAATATDKIPWLSTSRVRVGAAFDRFLIYATGGGGFGQFSTTVTGPGGSLSTSQWQPVLAVGGGLEYGFTQNLSGRVEYLYVDTGNIQLLNVAGATLTGRVQENIIRAGLNLRLQL